MRQGEELKTSDQISVDGIMMFAKYLLLQYCLHIYLKQSTDTEYIQNQNFFIIIMFYKMTKFAYIRFKTYKRLFLPIWMIL